MTFFALCRIPTARRLTGLRAHGVRIRGAIMQLKLRHWTTLLRVAGLTCPLMAGSGCSETFRYDTFDVPGERSCAYCPRPSTEWPGLVESAKGVRLGDDVYLVRDRLGKPDHIFRSYNGEIVSPLTGLRMEYSLDGKRANRHPANTIFVNIDGSAKVSSVYICLDQKMVYHLRQPLEEPATRN